MRSKSQSDLINFRGYLSGKVRPLTISLYINAVEKWFIWCREYNNGKFGPTAAQEYVNFMVEKSLSPSTINSRAHGIMRYLRWKKIDTRLDMPSIKRGEPVYLRPEETKKVIDSCISDLEKVLVITLYDTAVRIQELLNATVEDINRTQLLLRVIRKGGDEDLVNIGKDTLTVIDSWLKNRKISSGKVFPNLTYQSAFKLIRKVGQRAGFDDKVHPHIFRHSRAIMMLMNHVPINIVQRHLGHKTISTTIDIYGKFMAIDIKKEIPKI